MKNLKTSLRKVASNLMKTAKEIEKVASQLDAQTKAAANPVKKAPAKSKTNVSAKQSTAVDTVFGIIKGSPKGVNIAKIKQKTGYEDKKIHNLVYKLKKQGKIKSETKGVYVKL